MWQASQLLLLLLWDGFKRKMRKLEHWGKASHYVSSSFPPLKLPNDIVNT